MDPALIQDHLADAERHVSEGERHVARQRDVVAELERAGHDSEAARMLLRHIEAWLELHVADRDRLRQELRL